MEIYLWGLVYLLYRQLIASFEKSYAFEYSTRVLVLIVTIIKKIKVHAHDEIYS